MIADIKALKAQGGKIVDLDSRSSRRNFRADRDQQHEVIQEAPHVFDHKSLNILLWDRFVAVGALYSIVFVPMQMVFPELRMMFPDWMAVDVFLDVVFVTDLFVKATN